MREWPAWTAPSRARRVATLVGGFDRRPAYAGLADALVLLIGDGRIPAGTRLPSERELTEALGVSRTTVTRAYATRPRRRVRRGAAGLGHLHPGAGRAVARPRPGAAPPPERPGRDRPQLRRAVRAAGDRDGVRRGGDPAPGLPRRARLLPGRAARAAVRDRRAVRRPRAADRSRPGDGDPGRARGGLDRGPGAGRPRRPGAGRHPRLPQRRRADPQRRRPAGDHRGGPGRLGPRRDRGAGCARWRRGWPT